MFPFLAHHSVNIHVTDSHKHKIIWKVAKLQQRRRCLTLSGELRKFGCFSLLNEDIRCLRFQSYLDPSYDLQSSVAAGLHLPFSTLKEHSNSPIYNSFGALTHSLIPYPDTGHIQQALWRSFGSLLSQSELIHCCAYHIYNNAANESCKTK